MHHKELPCYLNIWYEVTRISVPVRYLMTLAFIWSIYISEGKEMVRSEKTTYNLGPYLLQTQSIETIDF